MPSYKQVFDNNRKWVAANQNKSSDFFKQLAKGQDPDFLYIGCSDSRVTAEEIMGAAPGEVFVHRNIANVVSNTDLNVMSVINYAIEYLHVKHVVVCGHYECGGVKAAMNPDDLGILNPWLRNVRDVFRLHKDELYAIKDEQLRYNRLIELNVEEQCLNIIKTAALQRQFLKYGYPTVHGWVFDIHTGLLKDLNINFEEKLSGIREIYNLRTDKDK